MSNFEKGLSPRTIFEKIHFATLDWKVPVTAAILYAVIVTIWGNYNKEAALKAEEPRVKSKKHLKAGSVEESADRFSVFKCLVIAHNVFLTLFSAYCFVCIVVILFNSYSSSNFLEAYCDKNLKQYYAGVNYLVWLFYLSKYYELLDTFILLMKGKPSSFLQTFHHSGSILSLWSMCITRIPGMWIFTFLNSFIHTLMYYYFTLTCLGYRPKWKRYLTSMQITQFFVGNVLGIAYIIIPNCYNWSHNFRENVLHHQIFGSYFGSIVFTFAFNFVFVGGLIILFNDFARRTYGEKKSGHSKSHDEEKSVVEPKKKVSKKSKASPVQIATSIVIEPEVESTPVKAAKPSKAPKASKPVKPVKPVKSNAKSVSRSKSRARSTVRSKSTARASSPAKTSPVRRSRRT